MANTDYRHQTCRDSTALATGGELIRSKDLLRTEVLGGTPARLGLLGALMDSYWSAEMESELILKALDGRRRIVSKRPTGDMLPRSSVDVVARVQRACDSSDRVDPTTLLLPPFTGGGLGNQAPDDDALGRCEQT